MQKCDFKFFRKKNTGTESNPMGVTYYSCSVLNLRNSRFIAPARIPSQFSTFIVLSQQSKRA